MNHDVNQQPGREKTQNISDDSYFDVVIIGGGIVGLSFANELAASDFSVAIIERNEFNMVTEKTECRVSAINRFSLDRFAQTGVLESVLSARICAFEKMFVWDQHGAGQIEFDSAELGIPELGAIIENTVLQQMLLEKIKTAENITCLCPVEITKMDYRYSSDQTATQADDSFSVIELSSGRRIHTCLLVGADGVSSQVREVAFIQRDQQSYKQQGLVCNVATSEPHQNTAWQCFMASGPLAFLPLYDGQSSIVWSLDEVRAQQVMALDDEDFKSELAVASEYKLGEILDVSKRCLFPLSHGHVNEYVKPGLALIGDAAHNIHPLAGQGANLGIADAVELAEIIKKARKSGRQWYALHTLKKYQRQRKGANMVMEASMTGFKNLFGNENALLAVLRNAGLSLVDHMPALKYRIIKQALGAL